MVLLAIGGCLALQIEDAVLLSKQRDLSDIVPPLKIEWVYNASAGFGRDGVVVVGDQVLVSTRSGDLHAVNVHTGKRAGIKSFGDALEAMPLVRGHTLYVPVDLGRRALYAYDLERSTVIWRWRGEPITVRLLALETGFVSADTRAVVRRHEGQSVIWQTSLGDDRFIHAPPLLAGGHVIVADDVGNLYALNPVDGAEQWVTTLHMPVYTAMQQQGTHLFVPTTRGMLFAVAATSGAIAWRYVHADTTARIATPAADSTMVVFGSTDGTVTALDPATGALVWQWVAPDAVVAAPYMNEHAVYVGTMGSMFYALDRSTGTVQWQEELRGRIKSDVVGYDDFLIVLSEPRYVYLLTHDDAY